MARLVRRSNGPLHTDLSSLTAGWMTPGLLSSMRSTQEHGAAVRTRTRCIAAERDSLWRLVLEVLGRRDVATARALVNATGPWLQLFAATVLRQALPMPVRLDKGTHIVVRRLFEHDLGYIFQTRDIASYPHLPYEQDFTHRHYRLRFHRRPRRGASKR